MTKCDTCGKEDQFPTGYNRNFCDECVSDKEIGVLCKPLEYTIVPQYGKVLKSRIEEFKRRVILPYEPDPKSGRSYYVGRRMDNGKIQEKTPNCGG